MASRLEQLRRKHYPNHPNGKILNMSLKKQWFEAFLSGQKDEEYREIKPYWTKRLVAGLFGEDGDLYSVIGHLQYEDFQRVMRQNYRWIKFTNGYGNHRPSFIIEFIGLEIGKPKGLGWHLYCDDEGQIDDVFIIKTGGIVSRTNC